MVDLRNPRKRNLPKRSLPKQNRRRLTRLRQSHLRNRNPNPPPSPKRAGVTRVENQHNTILSKIMEEDI